MKAIRVEQQGEPEVMKLQEAPLPEPGPAQVRIKVEVVGVNYIEIYQRSGQNNMVLPFTPGSEAGDVVDTLGEGVTGLKVGDRVVSASVSGAYAEYAIVPL